MTTEKPKVASRLIPKNVFAAMTKDKQAELIELKLPSSLRIQSMGFKPETYRIEDPIIYKNDVKQFKNEV